MVDEEDCSLNLVRIGMLEVGHGRCDCSYRRAPSGGRTLLLQLLSMQTPLKHSGKEEEEAGKGFSLSVYEMLEFDS